MDLNVRYLGLDLPHPVIASASPLSREVDGVRRLEDAGAAAVVMPSIYEEEVVADDVAYLELTEVGAGAHPEAGDYFPVLPNYRGSLDARLTTLSRAVDATDIPVIASLHSDSLDGWASTAAEVQEAGAAAIELNLYRVPTDIDVPGATVEQRDIDIVSTVRASVDVPLAVKLGPWFSSPGHHLKRLVEAGADGLVIFNRFYAPDIDLAKLAPVPDLDLSRPSEIRLPLMWLAVLSGRVKASLAATTGVETPDEVIKYLLAGADVVMTTSSLLRHGPGHVGTLVEGLRDWMTRRDIQSIDSLRGRLAANRLADPTPLFRAQYITAVHDGR